MIPSKYWEDALFECSSEDHRFFNEWTAHLPVREETTPYHSGPHSIKSLRAACLIVRPEKVLEIGFCLGHSASMFLNLGVEKVVSTDNSDRIQTMVAVEKMITQFGSRFQFWPRSQSHFINGQFDMIFIDGGHDFEDVNEDINFAKVHEIPYLLFDDFFPKWGPGTQPAIAAHKLVPIALLGNMCLCVPPLK